MDVQKFLFKQQIMSAQYRRVYHRFCSSHWIFKIKKAGFYTSLLK